MELLKHVDEAELEHLSVSELEELVANTNSRYNGHNQMEEKEMFSLLMEDDVVSSDHLEEREDPRDEDVFMSDKILCTYDRIQVSGKFGCLSVSGSIDWLDYRIFESFVVIHEGAESEDFIPNTYRRKEAFSEFKDLLSSDIKELVFNSLKKGFSHPFKLSTAVTDKNHLNPVAHMVASANLLRLRGAPLPAMGGCRIAFLPESEIVYDPDDYEMRRAECSVSCIVSEVGRDDYRVVLVESEGKYVGKDVMVEHLKAAFDIAVQNCQVYAKFQPIVSRLSEGAIHPPDWVVDSTSPDLFNAVSRVGGKMFDDIVSKYDGEEKFSAAYRALEERCQRNVKERATFFQMKRAIFEVIYDRVRKVKRSTRGHAVLETNGKGVSISFEGSHGIAYCSTSQRVKTMFVGTGIDSLWGNVKATVHLRMFNYALWKMAGSACSLSMLNSLVFPYFFRKDGLVGEVNMTFNVYFVLE